MSESLISFFEISILIISIFFWLLHISSIPPFLSDSRFHPCSKLFFSVSFYNSAYNIGDTFCSQDGAGAMNHFAQSNSTLCSLQCALGWCKGHGGAIGSLLVCNWKSRHECHQASRRRSQCCHTFIAVHSNVRLRTVKELLGPFSEQDNRAFIVLKQIKS